MQQILSLHEAIYNQFHQCSAGPAYFFLPQRANEYSAYYTSMYLIQDTAEAVYNHVTCGFSVDAMRAYLEFWGVMQAIEIQQDAICEVHQYVVGTRPNILATSAWAKLRDKRNLCAGHPANRTHGVTASQRTFMSRAFGTYAGIQYELWDAHTGTRTHAIFDLQQMINDYDAEASGHLSKVLTTMKAKWP